MEPTADVLRAFVRSCVRAFCYAHVAIYAPPARYACFPLRVLQSSYRRRNVCKHAGVGKYRTCDHVGPRCWRVGRPGAVGYNSNVCRGRFSVRHPMGNSKYYRDLKFAMCTGAATSSRTPSLPLRFRLAASFFHCTACDADIRCILMVLLNTEGQHWICLCRCRRILRRRYNLGADCRRDPGLVCPAPCADLGIRHRCGRCCYRRSCP